MNASDPAPNASLLTPFEACLLNISSALERPLSLAALHAAQTGADGDLTIRDILALAQKAGMQAGYGAKRLSELDNNLTPTLLLLAEDKAVVFHGRTQTGALLVFDPELGEGVGEVSEDRLAACHTGYAILFRRHHDGETLGGAVHMAVTGSGTHYPPVVGHTFRSHSQRRWQTFLVCPRPFSSWWSMTGYCPTKRLSR